jgi:uncharacterized protein
MAALASGIAWLRGVPLLVRPRLELPASPLLLSLGLGLALALLTTVSSRWLVARTAWARDLRAQMRPFLAGARPAELAALALLSGTAEELLFRGALQPWIGWVLASLLFGLVHIGPTRAFLPWTIWAVAMGFLLGAIVEWTGHLAGAMVAHVAINAVNLRFVADFDGALDEHTKAPAPGLVGPKRQASADHAVGARRAKISA